MRRNREEILMSRDTVIFLLQHLGFVINLEDGISRHNNQLSRYDTVLSISQGGKHNQTVREDVVPESYYS